MERIVVVGAGKVGFHLAKTLVGSGYEVVLIEKDQSRSLFVAQRLSVTVICGDGTDQWILKDAGTGKANYFVAVTGSDADNLVACQIAKKHYYVKNSIARVIDPANETLFRKLDIDAVINTTTLAAKTISNVLPSNGLRLTSIFDRGNVELAEVNLTKNSPVIGMMVSDLKLPKESLLIAILQGKSVYLPRGQSILKAEDRIFALVNQSDANSLRRVLIGGD
jgi:trk system potassium uptake protein TrkA